MNLEAPLILRSTHRGDPQRQAPKEVCHHGHVHVAMARILQNVRPISTAGSGCRRLSPLFEAQTEHFQWFSEVLVEGHANSLRVKGHTSGVPLD